MCRMPLGAWIFATALLLLIVLNKPFRKFFFWAAGVSCVGFVFFLGYLFYMKQEETQREERQAALRKQKLDSCIDRLTSSPDTPFAQFGGKLTAFADGATPASVCEENPDITYKQADAWHQK